MAIEGIPLVGLSAPAILGVVIMMILTGKLWTNAAYQEKVSEAERWRLAYEAEREARTLSDRQTTNLLEEAKTNRNVLAALITPTGTGPKSGESNVVEA